MVRSTFSSFPHSKKCRRLTRQRRDSNPGLLGEKRERYLCAMQPPVGPVLFGWVKARDVGWVTPNHRKAAATRLLSQSTTQQLYQGAGMPEKRGQKSRSQVELQIIALLGLQGRGSERTVFCFSCLQARDNDCTMQCAYSDACWVQIIEIVAIELLWFVISVYVWDVHDWLSIVPSPSENITRKRKKRMFENHCLAQ